jgi:hypothetical protein
MLHGLDLFFSNEGLSFGQFFKTAFIILLVETIDGLLFIFLDLLDE